MPKLFVRATNSFIQLGSHLVLDSHSYSTAIAHELLLRFEEKLEKSYDVDFSDICYFSYRPKSAVTSKSTNPFIYRELPYKRRASFARMKSHFLSSSRMPYSIKDSDYGQIVENAMALKSNEKFFKYQKYFYKRIYHSDSEITSVLYQ